VDGEMMSETESLEARVKQLEQLVERKVQNLEQWLKSGLVAQDRMVDVKMKSLGGLEPRVQILERGLERQNAVLIGILEQLRAIDAKMAVQQDTHRTEALAARVAELEKPWYRRVGATKTSGHPEADKSTLLRRMEAFNS